MTVQELIDKLNEVEDKTLVVVDSGENEIDHLIEDHDSGFNNISGFLILS